jgi:hypothetical protein
MKIRHRVDITKLSTDEQWELKKFIDAYEKLSETLATTSQRIHAEEFQEPYMPRPGWWRLLTPPRKPSWYREMEPEWWKIWIPPKRKPGTSSGSTIANVDPTDLIKNPTEIELMRTPAENMYVLQRRAIQEALGATNLPVGDLERRLEGISPRLRESTSLQVQESVQQALDATPAELQGAMAKLFAAPAFVETSAQEYIHVFADERLHIPTYNGGEKMRTNVVVSADQLAHLLMLPDTWWMGRHGAKQYDAYSDDARAIIGRIKQWLGHNPDKFRFNDDMVEEYSVFTYIFKDVPHSIPILELIMQERSKWHPQMKGAVTAVRDGIRIFKSRPINLSESELSEVLDEEGTLQYDPISFAPSISMASPQRQPLLEAIEEYLNSSGQTAQLQHAFISGPLIGEKLAPKQKGNHMAFAYLLKDVQGHYPVTEHRINGQAGVYYLLTHYLFTETKKAIDRAGDKIGDNLDKIIGNLPEFIRGDAARQALFVDFVKNTGWFVKLGNTADDLYLALYKGDSRLNPNPIGAFLHDHRFIATYEIIRKLVDNIADKNGVGFLEALAIATPEIVGKLREGRALDLVWDAFEKNPDKAYSHDYGKIETTRFDIVDEAYSQIAKSMVRGKALKNEDLENRLGSLLRAKPTEIEVRLALGITLFAEGYLDSADEKLHEVEGWIETTKAKRFDTTSEKNKYIHGQLLGAVRKLRSDIALRRDNNVATQTKLLREGYKVTKKYVGMEYVDPPEGDVKILVEVEHDIATPTYRPNNLEDAMDRMLKAPFDYSSRREAVHMLINEGRYHQAGRLLKQAFTELEILAHPEHNGDHILALHDVAEVYWFDDVARLLNAKVGSAEYGMPADLKRLVKIHPGHREAYAMYRQNPTVQFPRPQEIPSTTSQQG